MPNASGGWGVGAGFRLVLARLIGGSGNGGGEYLCTHMNIYACVDRASPPPEAGAEAAQTTGDRAATAPRPPYSTLSSLGLGRYCRPTLAMGLPSTITTSAVKSNRPRYSEEPTP